MSDVPLEEYRRRQRVADRKQKTQVWLDSLLCAFAVLDFYRWSIGEGRWWLLFAIWTAFIAWL